MERSRRSRGGPSKAAESLAKIREARLTGTTGYWDFLVFLRKIINFRKNTKKT